jgi:hypothetical protein
MLAATHCRRRQNYEKNKIDLILLGGAADDGHVDGGGLEPKELLELLGGSLLRDLGDSHGDLDALVVVHVVGLGASVLSILGIAATGVEDLDVGGAKVTVLGVGGQGGNDGDGGGARNDLAAVGREGHLHNRMRETRENESCCCATIQYKKCYVRRCDSDMQAENFA